MDLLWKIFYSFLKTGTFGFGGGQATIPLIQEEVVEKHAWLTEEQFIDYLAMGNTLPGPIATKMSVIIGYDLGGYIGAAAALLGMLLPSTLAILILFQLFLEYKDTAFVKGMQAAAKPVVVVLIAGVAFSMARSSVFSGVDFATSRTWIVFGLFTVATILVLLNELVPSFNVHPALIIMVSLLIGGLFIR
ncbi:chromate transporter [Candidatus Xianfuyuplasma coldseepsis]|uniref:Chromate transporter n=1 Tax=Candidatus Xianfuyuplasma coldseepsis TaxID=2782163 RepID=A0A7L7KT68_9MOLU|nr:chromate transporter [Xianfuyuplasma coldseepsis]QMS85482.1 chromate transporter [Xianfuyuplasma coldseepsis]